MNKLYFGFILLLVVFLHTSLSSFAQPDGSIPTKKYIDLLKAQLLEEEKLVFDTAALNQTSIIPVVVYIVCNNQGDKGISISKIKNSFDMLNTYFAPIHITFQYNVELINDYNYLNVSKDDSITAELLRIHYTSNKINIYLVNKIEINKTDYYGYTYFPTENSKNIIFLTKAYADGNSLATQVGHYLGLLATHENASGTELVNGSNCKSAGDFICDTYADPNIYSNVDKDCKYNGFSKDSNNEYFVPSVANIMADSNPFCKCKFTILQYKRMYFNYLKHFQYLK